MNPEHLLIDGKNIVYRAVYTARSDKRFLDSGFHPLAIFIRFISYHINKINPSNVHLFWDDRSERLWRRELLSEYKMNRNYDDKTGFPIGEMVDETIKICINVFRNLPVRQYFLDNHEADDLIYTFCKLSYESGSDTFIFSSDSDLRQIPFYFNNVRIVNPNYKDNSYVEDVYDYNVAIAKSLSGDASDNISGYYRIGEKRGASMAKSIKERYNFLKSDKAVDSDMNFVGSKLFELNRRVIDLSLSPKLPEALNYVEKRMNHEVNYDYQIVLKELRKNKIRYPDEIIFEKIPNFSRLING